jgi:hypothetical protein
MYNIKNSIFVAVSLIYFTLLCVCSLYIVAHFNKIVNHYYYIITRRIFFALSWHFSL